MKPIHYETMTAVSGKLRRGEITALALTELMLARIAVVDAELFSYATLMAEAALAQARLLDEEMETGRIRSPLHGIPIAVKDLCFTQGVRTMGGVKVLADFIPDFDATVVARLQAAGAIILGKLHLTEGAMTGYHRDFPIPLNPWDKRKWTGVSSSGSGVAAAAGLAFGTLGSDTGGSIRFPAAACGIVGLKPTWGRVSRHGVLPLAESLDHIGPMTRSVRDAVEMLQIIAGPDPQDPTTLPQPVPDFVSQLDGDIRGIRLGVDEAYIRSDSDPGVSLAIFAAIELLSSLGAEIVPVVMPEMLEAITGWFPMTAAEAAYAHRDHYPARAAEYGSYFGEMLALGSRVSGVELAHYQKLRAILNGQLETMFAEIDILVSPSSPFQPWVVDPEILYGPIGTRNPIRQKYSVPFDFNGAPTLSLPCGVDDEGMLFSLQLIGPRLGEALICRVGHAYEQATKWSALHPPL